MDWTSNSGLYKRYTDWKNQVEFLLDTDYSSLDEASQVKKILQWSGTEGRNALGASDLATLTKTQLWSKWYQKCIASHNVMQARTDLWLMRQGEQTLFEFYAALEKQITLCKFTNPPEILSTAFIIGLKDRATIKELIVKAGDKPDELPPDQCLTIASAMQCAVSASHHVQSSNNAPQATTVNQLRHKHTEITQKKYNKPNGRKGQKQGSQQKNATTVEKTSMVTMNKITNLGAKLEIKHAQIASRKDIYGRCANQKDIARIGKR